MATIYVPKGTTDLGTTGVASGDSLEFHEGSQHVTGGLNLSAFATGLISVYGAAAFTGRVGGGGFGYLRADVDAGAPNIVRWTNGELNIQPGGNNTLITLLELLGTGTVNVGGGGTLTSAGVASGRMLVTGDVVLTNLRMFGGFVRQQYHATANTVWRIDGGELHTGRGVSGLCYIGTGARVVVAREDTSATLPTGGTMIVGGALHWRGGNITAVELTGDGFIDLSECPGSPTIAVAGTARALARCNLDSKFGLSVTPTEYVGKRGFLFPALGLAGGGAPTS